MTKFQYLSMLSFFLLMSLTHSACLSTNTKEKRQILKQKSTLVFTQLKNKHDIQYSKKLNDTAEYLCKQNSNQAIVDLEMRQKVDLKAGQITVLHATTLSENVFIKQSTLLLNDFAADALGSFKGQNSQGQPCFAMLAVKHIIRNFNIEIQKNQNTRKIIITGSIAAKYNYKGLKTTLFMSTPAGPVLKRDLSTAKDGHFSLSINVSEAGLYIAEIMHERSASDPQIAILSPLRIKKINGEKAPVASPPKVIESVTITDQEEYRFKAEALIHRLRNNLKRPSLKMSGKLTAVAQVRASDLSRNNSFGHTGAFSESPDQSMQRIHPEAQFRRLAEIQAQASSLKDAWQALWNSPAHRYILLSKSFDHLGVGISIGKDALGRKQITLVALFSEKHLQRAEKELIGELFAKIQLKRKQKGLSYLKRSQMLDRVAQKFAQKFAYGKIIKANAMASEIIRSQSELGQLTIQYARLDDPIRLQIGAALGQKQDFKIGLGIVSTRKGYSVLILLKPEYNRAPSF